MSVNRTPMPVPNQQADYQQNRAADAPIDQQLPSLARDLLLLVRQEVQLAKIETSEKIMSIMRYTLVIGMGCFIAYAGLITLVVAAVTGYGEFLPSWLSAALISLLLFVLSAMVIYTGRTFLYALQSSLRTAPKRTHQSLESHTP